MAAEHAIARMRRTVTTKLAVGVSFTHFSPSSTKPACCSSKTTPWAFFHHYYEVSCIMMAQCFRPSVEKHINSTNSHFQGKKFHTYINHPGLRGTVEIWITSGNHSPEFLNTKLTVN